MMILHKHFLSIASLLSSSALLAGNAANIKIGDDPDKFDFRWADGVCYLPVKNVRVGDTLEFSFRGHDLYQMHTIEAYDSCNFSSTVATQLASYGESPYLYTVTPQDAQPLSSEVGAGEDSPASRSLFFSCSIGSHCLGKQRVRVEVDVDSSASQVGGASSRSLPLRTEDPVSKFVLGADEGTCSRVQRGEADVSVLDRFMESNCEEAVTSMDKYGREIFTTSCLSPPVTLTPGGVINEATILHFPFPTDHRVILGGRTWEFVQGAKDNLQPVYVNQLYVHHIIGGIIMGNGAESIRRLDEDAPFPRPYGKLSGNFNDRMTLHLIDLRETGDKWMECLECRCRDGDGGFSLFGGSGGDGRLEDEAETGSISCCSNCTDLVGPTVDYRLRYNVSWSEIDDSEKVRPVVSMTSDMAIAMGTSVEWDVPMYKDLPKNQQSPDDPTIMVLERTGTLTEVFGDSTFDRALGLVSLNDGLETLEILRCIGHMHIAALNAWVRHAETGELICHNNVTYGDDPATTRGFITSVGVQDFDPPLVLPIDTKVTVTMHYDATILHTGVMGILTLFVADHDDSLLVTKQQSGLTVDVCEAPICVRSMLPNADDVTICKDELQDGFICNMMGVCDCETFLKQPQVVGGCGGELVTNWGNSSVDNYCAKHCGCRIQDDEEAVNKILREAVEDRFRKQYRDVCRYNSEECAKFLSNYYACIKEDNANLSGSSLHPRAVRDALKFEQGTIRALNYAELGDEAMHRLAKSEINEKVLPCKPEIFAKEVAAAEAASKAEAETSSSRTNALSVLSIVAVAVVSFMAV